MAARIVTQLHWKMQPAGGLCLSGKLFQTCTEAGAKRGPLGRSVTTFMEKCLWHQWLVLKLTQIKTQRQCLR